MPTYTLISSNVLSVATASVTFSSIPSTYTDIVLHASVRTTRSQVFDYINLTMNGTGGTAYTSTEVYGNGGGLTGATQIAGPVNYLEFISGNTAATNAFGYTEVYFSQYKNTSYQKNLNALSGVGTTSPASSAYVDAWAGLFNSTSAISSITMTPGTGNFVAGTSFYLYGIANS